MLIILEDQINPNNNWFPEEGDLIGRGDQCKIRIRDPKVSGVHAKVEKDSQGQLILVDQNSHNGLVLGGRKVKRITLIPGLEFQLGTTHILVRSPSAPSTPTEDVSEGTRSIIKDLPPEIAEAFSAQEALENISASPKEASDFAGASADKNEITPPPIQIQDLPWDLQMPIFLQDFAEAAKQNPLLVQIPQSFVPHLRLHFEQGIQVGTTWDLYFAPTKLGKLCSDRTLQDPMAPDELAVITADSIGQPVVQSLCGNFLKINGRSFTSCPLRDGDVMSFGNTVIKVRFL